MFFLKKGKVLIQIGNVKKPSRAELVHPKTDGMTNKTKLYFYGV